MKQAYRSRFWGISTFALVLTLLALAGCGGGGGSLSTQVVSGVAAVGLPLAGQVTLKDSSSQAREKTALIDQNGAFAFDVTGLTPPFLLQATGSASGTSYTLHSCAKGTGIANVNPLSDVIVAQAAGVSDAATAYADPDPEHRKAVGTNLSGAAGMVMAKLQPLLTTYGASNLDPITSQYVANHQNLDKMFDEVKITVAAGVLSIVNVQSGAVILQGGMADLVHAPLNTGNIPVASAVPVAPSMVVGVGSTGQVNLTWNQVANASSYNIYYATTSGVTTATGTKISASNNSYQHTGLSAGTTYYYVVTAVNSSGESAASAQVQAAVPQGGPAPAPPAAPAGVTATGGSSQVTLSWPAVPGATSYNIYWSKTPGVTTTTGTKLANASSPAVHALLTDATTYYYVVTSVNAAGESAASVQISATTLAATPAPAAPSAVTGVSASGGQNQVTLTWQPVTGATSYNIYYGTSTGVSKTTGAKLASVTSPYVHNGLTAGTTFYYVVTAVNSLGESANSAQASATTSPAAVVDGLALYNQYCAGCHGTSKLGKTAVAIQGAIDANIGGMGSLKALSAVQVAAIGSATATPTPTPDPTPTPTPVPTPTPDPTPTPAPVCGSCHAIPPATGRHSKHKFTTCATCHGTGYSSTSVNSSTHANGVKNVGGSSGWNATTRTCSNSCHGSKSW